MVTANIFKVFLTVIFLSVSGWTKNRIFFHWASAESNREILSLSHFNFQGKPHHSGLGSGQYGILNESVITRFQEWYFKEQTDAAGAGLYVSRNIVDSIDFGGEFPDLMVVEIPNFDEKFIKSDGYSFSTFYKNQQMSASPLIYNYDQANWFVIPRVPKINESPILLRPPIASDLDLWFNQLLELTKTFVASFEQFQAASKAEKQREVNKLIFNEINLIQQRQMDPTGFANPYGPHKQITPTRSSEILLDRIVYDKGYDFIIKNVFPELVQLTKNKKVNFEIATFFGGLLSASNMYFQKIPNDNRTQVLTDFALEQILKFNSDDLKNLLEWHESDSGFERITIPIKDIVDFLNRVEIKSRRKILQTLLENDLDSSKIATSDISKYLSLKEVSNLSINEKEAIDHFVVRNILETSPNYTEELGSNPKGIVNLLAKTEEGQNWITKKLRYIYFLDNSLDKAKHSGNGINSIPVISSRPSLPGTSGLPGMPGLPTQSSAGSLETYADLTGDQYLKIFKPILKDFLNLTVKPKLIYNRFTEVYKILAYCFVRYPNNFQELLEFGKSELRLAKTKKLNNLQSRFPFFDTLDIFYGDSEKGPFNEIELVEKLGNSFSELKEVIILSLEKSLSIKVDDVSHIRRIKLMNKIRQESDLSKSQNRKSHAIKRWLDILNHGLVSNLPKKALVDIANIELLPVLYPIEGSIEYSELAKVFGLVDPLFVLEDLWIKNNKLPQYRFNLNYKLEGQSFTQPAWENFTEAWGLLTFFNASNKAYARSKNTAFISSNLNIINELLMSGFIDRNSSFEGNSWNRKKFKTVFKKNEWDSYSQNTKIETELSTFFIITKTDENVTLEFKSYKELKSSSHSYFQSLSNIEGELIFSTDSASAEQIRLFRFIDDKIRSITDPMAKAFQILYLVPKIHPAENGNGRLARLWASNVLRDAGYPLPVGFPTNDFLMSSQRMYWELRKSLVLGKFYQDMLLKSKKSGIPADRFFATTFKNSALEGLLHVAIKDDKEFKDYVQYLESLSEPPTWAKDFTSKVVRVINEFRTQFSGLEKAKEVTRDFALKQEFIKFQKEINLSFSARNINPSERPSHPLLSTQKESSRGQCFSFYIGK